jgi:hypothetical protein
MGKMKVVRELLDFMWAQKMYWLAPIVLVLVLFGLLVVFAETSVLAPFIYTLF